MNADRSRSARWAGRTVVRRYADIWGEDFTGDPEPVDGREAIGWRGLCSCGWRGPLWTRMGIQDGQNLTAAPGGRLVYDGGQDLADVGGVQVDARTWGDSPAPVGDAIYAEWKGHLEPAAITAVRQAAADVRACQGRLDDAVHAARTDGQSCTTTGAALGMTARAPTNAGDSDDRPPVHALACFPGE